MTKKTIFLIFLFIFSANIYSYDKRDTSDIQTSVKDKLRDLEELIDQEIIISEFYNGDYHIILKSAIDFSSQARELFEKKQFDEAIKKIETAQEFANRVLDLANKEPHELKDKTIAKMQQLEKLMEYSQKIYFNNNSNGASAKLKELFQEGQKFYKQARDEMGRKEYVSAMDSINLAVNYLLGAMKQSIDELVPEVENIIKGNLSKINDITKDGIDIVSQSGSNAANWYFNQAMKYIDIAEKTIRGEKYSQSYEMTLLGIGYANMSMRIARDKIDDSILIVPNKAGQKKTEESIEKQMREGKLLETYESLLKMKDRLFYLDVLIEQAGQSVNGKNDYVLNSRLNRLLEFRQKVEISSLLEDYNALSTFQFIISKLSYNIIELSKTRIVKK